MLLSLQSLLINPARAARSGPGTDITTLNLAALDMAFALQQSIANEIARMNALLQQPFTISHSSTVSFSGTLAPMVMPNPLSFGVVGDAVGSGVFTSMQLQGSATVNGTTYPGPIPILGVPQAFWLQEQTLILSTAAQAQLTYLTSTYGQLFQCSYWGLDYGKMTIPTTQAAPTNTTWAAADWIDFCQAVQAQLALTPIPNGQVTLMQGISPNGQSNQWNFGPTQFCCFNVPPLDSGCEPAIVYGFMVSGHPLPQNFTSDFQSVQLFTQGTTPNGLLVASAGIVLNNIVPAIAPSSALQAAAGLGTIVYNSGNLGLQAYGIASGAVNASSTTPPGGWPVGYAGSCVNSCSSNSYEDYKNASATTVTGAGLAFAEPENGLFQQLIASGGYTVWGGTGGNQNVWQFAVPPASFTWSAVGVMGVNSSGVVSFGSNSSSFPWSFPNSPGSGGNSDYTWWDNPPSTWASGLISGAMDWGNNASNAIAGSFCQGSTNGQLNFFAFPGGVLYQSAVGGINQNYNMVLNLTYVIPG